MRGPLPAPENIVIVTIDRESSDRLELPNLPRKWPRGLHTRLVKKLAQQQAALVLFDMIFEETSDPDQDRQFGAAIRDAKNVVLFERLQRETILVRSVCTAAMWCSDTSVLSITMSTAPLAIS